MFVDTAKVSLRAGKGGDGAVSFRHEIYVDKGGPDGGDGGRGGDIIFIASKDVNTLIDFRFKPELKAEHGKNGFKQNQRGRSGAPLKVRVPVGTVVKQADRIMADLVRDGQEEVIARGGDGGYGNAHFKSSTRQTPRMAELGEQGDEYEVELELKLLADVGLVGFPNAGKSTFLSVVSNAKPDIADYAFTTLTPNLGVADIDDGTVLIADIPGLIEGASEGKGLGDAFLRHVERTAVLLHMIDAYNDDVAASYQTIRKELAGYSEALIDRPEVIVLTKIDGLDDELINMQIHALRHVVGDKEIMTMSSQSGNGVKEVLRRLRRVVGEVREAERERADAEGEASDIPTISLKAEAQDLAWRIDVRQENEQTTYVIKGRKIEKFARRTNFDNYESLNRLRDIMKKMGITHQLTRQGAVSDSIIRIGLDEFTLVEQ